MPTACPRCGHQLAGEAVPCPACAAGVGAVGEQTTAAPRTDSAANGHPVPNRPGPASPAEAAGLAPPGYEVVAELGRGGMGVVYRARQVALRREVALKMVLSGAHAGAAERARFRTEAEALARLKHPGIVAIHEVGEHAERPFLCMEYCPGGSLEQRLAGAPMLPRPAAALVQKLAVATEAAHRARVVHRDLKPGNVMLTAEGEPRISDFGLARQLDDAGLTVTGTVMGTPSYMAPEQARGEKVIGPPADVYALGAILYECLTGRPPFRAATTFDTMAQVLHDEPVAPTVLNTQVPRDLETVCLKCLQKEPGRRYGSAQALADDLGRWLAGEPITARRVGRLERAGKWVRRNPVVTAMSAAIGLVLVVGIVASTLFALDAGREAARANDKAEEAEREKEKAERALAEVEKTLIDGLLRPIGRSGDRPGPAEVEALERVGGLSDDRRLRFLEVGLETPAVARRLGLRARWVAQAVVGVDRGRRGRAVALLTRRLNEPGAPREVAFACVLLGTELDLREPGFLLKGLSALISTWYEAQSDMSETREGAIRLLQLLEPSDLAKAAEAIITSWGKSGDAGNSLLGPGDLPAHVLDRLPRAEAALRARQMADITMARLRRAEDLRDVALLARKIGEVLEYQPDAEAAQTADQTAEVALGWLRRERVSSADFYDALSSVADKLTAPVRKKASESALAALTTSRGVRDASSFGSLLEPLFKQMPSKDRASYARRAMTVVLAVIEKPDPQDDELQDLVNLLLLIAKEDAALSAVACHALLPILEKARKAEHGKIAASAIGEALRPGDRKAQVVAAKAAVHLLDRLDKSNWENAAGPLVLGLTAITRKLDRPTARLVAERVVTAMTRFDSGDQLQALHDPLMAALHRLPHGEAARFATRAAETDVAHLRRPRSDSDRNETVREMGRLFAFLAPEQARRCAAAALAALPVSVDTIGTIALVLDVNAFHLEDREVARIADVALEALTSRNMAFYEAQKLASLLLSLHQRLTPAEAARRTSQVASPLIGSLVDKKDRSLILTGVPEALLQALDTLPAAEGTEVARKALAVLRASMSEALMSPSQNRGPDSSVSGDTGSLTLLLARLGTEELVPVLDAPVLAPDIREAVLNAIGLRTRMRFRSPHHLVAWAEANGVDLRAGSR